MELSNGKMLVTPEPVNCYQIGENYFVVHPITGMLHEIESGRIVTADEGEAYLDFILSKKS